MHLKMSANFNQYSCLLFPASRFCLTVMPSRVPVGWPIGFLESKRSRYAGTVQTYRGNRTCLLLSCGLRKSCRVTDLPRRSTPSKGRWWISATNLRAALSSWTGTGSLSSKGTLSFFFLLCLMFSLHPFLTLSVYPLFSGTALAPPAHHGPVCTLTK